MDLKQYDRKLVRIMDSDGLVFEGLAEYYTAELCEVLYEEAEEALKICDFLFYKSTIEAVEEIQNFSAPYGTLEEMSTDDTAFIEDILFDYEDVHTLRMLDYLEDHPHVFAKEMPAMLEMLIRVSDNARVVAAARSLLKKLRQEGAKDA